jgi:hypothetical protein
MDRFRKPLPRHGDPKRGVPTGCRPLAVVAAALASVFALLGPSSASAVPPHRETVSFSHRGVVDCGTFKDRFTDFFDARGVEYFDSAGNLIRAVVHWEHHSNDTNSVTGLTLHEHGHFTETVDVLTGTDTITGSVEIMNRPGTGVVVQDVGKAVFDADGNLVFFAGGRKHSEVLLGDQVLCDALA